MSTRKLLTGFFQTKEPEQVPDGSIFFMTPDNNTWIDWTPERIGNRLMVMELHPAEEEFANDAALKAHLDRVKGMLDERGIKPAAFSFAEELAGGPPRFWANGKTGFDWADLFRDRMNEILGIMKTYWPQAYSLQIEGWYNDVRLFGPGYYHPAYACDILALDPYMLADGSPHWHTAGMPLNAHSPQEKFYLEVARLYEHAAASYSQPILMIPQAYHSPTDAMLNVAPTPQQLRWWFDLAQRLPKVVAICWFARYSYHESIAALDQHPELWAEVQRECQEMGYERPA